MKLGDMLTITQVYQRRTRYERCLSRQQHSTRMRVWEAADIKPRQAIFLGLRTLCNGSSEWENEVGYVFDPDKDGYIKAALVCFSTKENPVYVPVEAMSQ